MSSRQSVRLARLRVENEQRSALLTSCLLTITSTNASPFAELRRQSCITITIIVITSSGQGATSWPPPLSPSSLPSTPSPAYKVPAYSLAFQPAVIAPPEQVLSSGSVVFALPHIRETIFRYHALELVKERNAQLDAIARPVRQGFYPPTAASSETMLPSTYFANRLASLSRDTNLLAIINKLGLQVATYIWLLASRREDSNLWIAACSTLGSSLKWGAGYGWGSEPFLEALPRVRARYCSTSETPGANAMEMLWYARERYYYHNRMLNYYGPEWSDLDGFAHLLRDDMGHLFVLRLLSISRRQFPFKMARERPDIIYSESSCLYPLLEVFEYSASIGAIITRCPPWPICPRLIPNSGRDELRRVLEFAHDIFGILAQLEDCQASLKKCRLNDSWEDVFSTSAGKGPWLIPAYLEKEEAARGQKPSKLTRSDMYIEQLPPAPLSAWPLAPLLGNDGIAGLPWCQLTAYNDPRVPGPKTYLDGLTEVIWHDDEYAPQSRHWVDEVPADRFRYDLLDGVACILARLFGSATSWREDLRILQSPKTSIAYEEGLRDGANNGPREPSSGHSGLFMCCVTCIMDYGTNYELLKGEPGHCKSCGDRLHTSAMPDSLRILLLRIVEPTVRADGSKEMVKAREALAEIKRINATEIPRLEKVYHAWVNNQKKVERMTTAGPLPLEKIRADVSAPRWMLLEMLRGNLLNSRFRKKEFIDLRDTVKSFLAEREAERKKLERGADEEAGTVDAHSKASTAPTPASEEEVAALLSTAATESVKRSPDHADEEAGAAKKRKAA